RPAVGEVADRLALGLDARIERGRPGVADNVDRARGVRARKHGPDQLFEIGHVDVVVDHDHIAPAIGADVAHGRDMAGLLGMTGIALVDGDGSRSRALPTSCAQAAVTPGTPAFSIFSRNSAERTTAR